MNTGIDMRFIRQSARRYPGTVLWLTAVLSPLASAVSAAPPITPEQQNTLVHKYCAVCHTDAVRNGGLSLQHYEAAQADPALAAMLLSKLRNGAMGAAGRGVPDPAAQSGWVR